MAKYIGYGTIVSIEDDLMTLVPIANVVSANPIGDEAALVDVTSFDSPQQRREFLGGLRDAQEVALSIQFDPDDTTHVLIRDGVAQTRNFEVTFPTPAADTVAFAAVILSAPLNPQLEDAILMEATLKPTGTFTWTSTP